MLLDDEPEKSGQSFITGKPGALQHLLELSPDSSGLRVWNRHWSEYTSCFQTYASMFLPSFYPQNIEPSLNQCHHQSDDCHKGFWLSALFVAVALAQYAGTFTPAGNMTVPRLYHTATLLTNGKVLMVGSEDGPPGYCCRSAELYDPVTGTFAPTGEMTAGRVVHTATLLPDGKVLIAGPGFVPCVTCGGPGVGPGPTAELYSPVTGTFAPTGEMITPRGGFSATLLANGKVLIAGGSCCDQPLVYPTTAELYYPSTGTFASTGDMINGRENHTATLLSNGKVLIAGGQVSDTWVTPAELYDPGTGTFSVVGDTSAISGVLGIWLADLLPDGTVLGLALRSDNSAGAAGAVYDPSAAAFHATGSETAVRGGTATLLPNGTVLTAGWSPRDLNQSADLYDPAKGAFASTGKLNTPRAGHTATLLPDGTVLVCGGMEAPEWVPLSSAEIYRPSVAIPAAFLKSLPDGSGQGAVLYAGTSDVATAAHPAMPGEILEIYGSGLLEGSVIPPQVSIGGHLAEVLWFGNAPAYAGLNQINVRVPADIAPGPAVPLWLNYLGRPSNLVTIGVGQP
jgi:hypothetical protein